MLILIQDDHKKTQDIILLYMMFQVEVKDNLNIHIIMLIMVL